MIICLHLYTSGVVTEAFNSHQSCLNICLYIYIFSTLRKDIMKLTIYQWLQYIHYEINPKVEELIWRYMLKKTKKQNGQCICIWWRQTCLLQVPFWYNRVNINWWYIKNVTFWVRNFSYILLASYRLNQFRPRFNLWGLLDLFDYHTPSTL